MNSVDEAFALFDSDDGGAILLSNYRRAIHFDLSTAHSRNLEQTFKLIEAAAASGEWVALAVDYALGAYFEPSVASLDTPPPPLRGWVFGGHQHLDATGVAAFLTRRLEALSEPQRHAGVAEVRVALDALAYTAKVQRIKQWIAAGDCYQINLTFPLDFKVYGHPLALYSKLRQRQPVRYGAFISVPEETLLSCSPELFFERSGDHVVTRPIKGTAPRGATPTEDAERRCALLASEKERAENIMIVDLLRNDLSRLATPGAVRVESLCEAEAYPTLWQVVSTISAELPGVCLFDLFRALFPCGSITGAPKIRAMQCLAELEERPRGLYSGALGWLAPGGDCRFNVAIRTVQFGPNGQARLGIGSGIVIDADPEREYAECLLKANFLTGFDPGFELIETLRVENGECPLLQRHLTRLEASARALGFAYAGPTILAVLQAEFNRTPNGTNRARLTLAHDGKFKLVVSPLPEEKRAWQAIFAEENLDADDYLLRHKTTARSRYDRALAGLPEGIFDAIFLNTRGEVCEGARSNVFIERDALLLTPPLRCGLLPGVMRHHLLESGRAVESVLTVNDLRNASKIYLGNALRGLIPVSLRD